MSQPIGMVEWCFLAFSIVPEYYYLYLQHHCLHGKTMEKQHTIYNKLHIKQTPLDRIYRITHENSK
ncbi:hypothetical protein KsCSTR_34890 [Candidatus Kuenenia stuttgartiensis]|uniref:Uncharacterized protein n=1 Tax=Kuenenia stuttgartiensis TaxID=174633 RepID=Q1Q6X9_KUEST|nr:hypothetical protein KsCSTR_34890 [Candidatus Kuenenia stuttgartiensis]CAJ73323.1 unknown protein [Candidatus Kuenenia stuttgartiensis]